MAPAPSYDLPPVQLRRLAVLARRRGLSFEEFWIEAVRPGKKQGRVTTAHPDPPAGAVRWPSEWSEGTQWRAAIIELKGAWCRAYDGEEPTGPERAVIELGDSIGVVVAAVAHVLDEEDVEPAEDIAELMAA